MIRHALRSLATDFPLFTFLGAAAICAAGLMSLDMSLAMLNGHIVLKDHLSFTAQLITFSF